MSDTKEINQLQEQYELIQQMIVKQIQVKDEMINKLYAELEGYKEVSANQFSDQLMKAVIKVRKDMRKIAECEAWETITVEELKREYIYILEDLTDLLESQNIDSYTTEAGERFNSSIHQPRLETTEDISLDKKVKQSLSEGYKKGTRILQAERVIVYKYQG